MGLVRSILICVSLALLSSAQQPSSPTYRVTGTVIDSSTGNPLPRALVKLPQQAVLSGAEGKFSFDQIPAGEEAITVTKPGYLNPGPNLMRWPELIRIGPETNNVVLKLLPEAVVFGQVMGNDGDPLEGAGVDAFTFISREGHRTRIDGGTARTDEDGNFRIARLPAGDYYITVKPQKVSEKFAKGEKPGSELSYPSFIYYPDATDFSEAMPVALKPSQHLEVRFSLKLQPAFEVSGRVIGNGRWKQINEPSIVEHSGQPLFAADKFDPTTGEFRFHAVPAGTYQIQVYGIDMRDHPSRSIQKVVITGAATNLDIVLRQGVDIPVVVRTKFSRLQRFDLCGSGATVGKNQESECANYPLARVGLRADEDFQSFGEDDKSQTVLGVLPGTYRVTAGTYFGGSYVESLRSGGVDLFREDLVIPENGSTAPIEVVLRDDPATLKVQIRAEKEVQQAAIVIVPNGEVRNAERRTAWGSMTIEIGGLAPGNYQVFAFDSIEDLNYAEPGVLAKYSAKAGRIALAPNGNSSITVDLIHAEE